MTGKYYTAENYDSRSNIGYLIRHANKLLTSQVTQLFSEQEISFMQYTVMILLRDGLASTAAEIGQSLCHDSGALTRVIDQLEERCFVQRERHAHDKRIIELKLTEKGHNILDSFCPAVFSFYNAVLADFTNEEIGSLVDLLTRLITGFTFNATTSKILVTEEAALMP